MGTPLPTLGALALLLFWPGLPARGDEQSGSPTASPERAFARDLLRELVEINTTPAYGCTRAAEAMAARLRSAGFPDSDVLIAGPRPDKQNLVVRLRGRSQAKPILLITHLDVVDAPREGWAPGLDPFRLTERDGFFYGRGVQDDKQAVAGLVATLIRLRAEAFVPGRDIIVALTADMDPWAGDSAQMRRAGFPTFGVSGVFSDDLDNPHGANERLAVDASYESVEFLHRLMKTLAIDAPR
jgi:acetylornithine deacetylase/succinyl-diaminopimelate desuccinylase-like protein